VDFAGENDPNALDRARVFKRGLERLGWAPMIDYYWSVFNVERAQRAAEDVLKVTPDVIVCAGTPATKALKQATSTVPIVFAIVTEPVAQGIVESLAQPGGNLTGFSYLEPTVAAKWLELLMQIAPQLKHVALMFNPASSPYAQNVFFNRLRPRHQVSPWRWSGLLCMMSMRSNSSSRCWGANRTMA
jgi:putative tryptophan/tyrosine transport system substrate-binding protein